MLRNISYVVSLLIAFAPVEPAQRPIPPATFNISGQVTFKGKQAGVEGVEIVFERVSSKGPAPNSVRIDATGRWSQSGFQQGATYRAIPKKQGFVFDPVSLEFNAGRVSLSFNGRPVAETKAGTKPGLVIEGRPKTFGSSGKVTTPDGRGIPGVKITFSLASGTGAAPGEVETDAQGRWTQGGFDRDASYTVRPRRLPGDTFTPPAGTLSDPRGQNFQITIPKFAAAGRVGARTKGTGLANVTITFSLESGVGPVPAAVTTNERGEWIQQGFEVGARYKATPSKGAFQFTPGSVAIVHVGTVGTQPSAQLRDVNFSVPDVFVVSGVISEIGDGSRSSMRLGIKVVSGGQREIICHTALTGSSWSKELETGKTYEIEPDVLPLPTVDQEQRQKVIIFTPNSIIVDGPKQNVNFSIRFTSSADTAARARFERRNCP